MVLVLAAVVAVAAAAKGGDDGSSKARTASADLGTDGTSGDTGGGTSDGGTTAGSTTGADTGGSGGSTSDGSSGQTEAELGPPAPLPLEPEISHTKGLRDGDEVTIDVKADDGSLIYGVEMRMCRADSVIRNDGDMLPTVTGQCASKPLSPGADGHKIVPSEAPHEQVTTTYKVGTGTDTYELDDASTNSVTCDADHPCVLAVKYQIPNGFGFRTYPLTFS
jgi:hypothetical protein